VQEVYEKWDLHVVKIGEVTEDGNLRVRENGIVVADIPVQTLVLGGEAPVYVRETQYPSYLENVHSFDPDSIEEPKDYNDVLKKLLSSPNIASKNYLYTQYDHMVRIKFCCRARIGCSGCKNKRHE